MHNFVLIFISSNKHDKLYSEAVVIILREMMNNVLSRANILGRYNSRILFGLGEPSKLQWHSSFISLSRVMHQHIFGIRFDQTQSKKALAVQIRKIGCENQSFSNLFRGTIPIRPRCFSTMTNYQNLHPKKRKRVQSAVMRTLKIICMISGLGAWIILVISLLLIDDLKLETSHKDEFYLPELIRSSILLGSADGAELFYEELHEEGKADLMSNQSELKSEVVEKIHAFREVWIKLKDEEGIQSSLGDSVDICGYKWHQGKESNVSWNIDEDERKTKWMAVCYIEGSLGIATLNILFERPNTESKWVATKLHLEKIKETGEVLFSSSIIFQNDPEGFMQLSDPEISAHS